MSRVIRRSSGQSSSEVASLLQSLLATEFLRPSKTIWLVSPWISDIPILDNTTGDFEALGHWGPRHVRLSEVLASLAVAETTIVVATTSDRTNEQFLGNLTRMVGAFGADGRLIIHGDQADLHEKAFTTDASLIFGSMNFTYNGVFIRGELVEFTTDPERVSDARLDNHHRFGGVL